MALMRMIVSFLRREFVLSISMNFKRGRSEEKHRD
jgi:hypothetical protein